MTPERIDGDGRRSIRRREHFAKMGGTIAFSNGQGTRVRIEVPLG